MSIKLVLDTETTGLSTSMHEVVEVGIVRSDDRVQLYNKIKAEKPETASWDALKITGKTLKDLEDGDSKEDIVNKCNEFFSSDGLTPAHRCIVAHNAPFDRKFIHALWEKVGLEFPANLWLDTITLTSEFIKKSDPATLNITKTATGKISKALHAACDLLNIKKIALAHNAKVDSRNTYLLWKKLMDEGIDYLPHIKTFVHTVAPQTSVEDLLKNLEECS